MVKLLLIDLDGTLRRTQSGKPFINEPHDQEIIPEAFERLRVCVAADWIAVGITNQGGVHAGHKTLESCITEQRLTLSLLPELSRIVFCPDDGWTCWQVNGSEGWDKPLHYFRIDDLGHWRVHEGRYKLAGSYRKPRPGMLHYAVWSVGVPTEVHYVGDREEDAGAALAAGVPFSWALDWQSAGGEW